MQPFAIHALPVAGGTLALGPLPGRSGDYAGDWRFLADWQPACVISLTSEAEMAAHGAAALADDLRAAGIGWRHLPVVDFGVPEGDGCAGAVEVALPILGQGGRVFVHCLGGCGRSGMLALRMMIAAGEVSDAALRRLRSIRPCAIETCGQMQWAMAASAGA